MSAKYLVPAVLATLLAGAATTASADPARERVVADLQQARQEGSAAPSDAGFVYPAWVQLVSFAGTLMTDGHPELDTGRSAASNTVRTAVAAAAPAPLMSDGHPELEATSAAVASAGSATVAIGAAQAPAGKGSDSAR